MAREANMPFYWRSGEITYLEQLKVFEALVRADEREAFRKIQFESILQAIKIERDECARIAEASPDRYHAAATIRARGNT